MRAVSARPPLAGWLEQLARARHNVKEVEWFDLPMSRQRRRNPNRANQVVATAKPLRASSLWDHFATVNLLPDDVPTLSVRMVRNDGLIQDQRMILNYYSNASEKWIAETQAFRITGQRRRNEG
jgi:hypothetical protein